ncbi:MAG: GNAT family N-acetyltransferase [Chloroflexota bacterium]
MHVDIRPVSEDVLFILYKNVRASYKRPHAIELRDQSLGLLTFYVVWLEHQPIGTGFVRWDGPRDPDVHKAYPTCPEIYRLGINPDFQSQGIGTQLIGTCEQEAQKRGFRQIGLGVAHENPRAYALYRRLGYSHSSIERYIDEYQFQAQDGAVKTVRDPLRFLVKGLR